MDRGMQSLETCIRLVDRAVVIELWVISGDTKGRLCRSSTKTSILLKEAITIRSLGHPLTDMTIGGTDCLSKGGAVAPTLEAVKARASLALASEARYIIVNPHLPS